MPRLKVHQRLQAQRPDRRVRIAAEEPRLKGQLLRNRPRRRQGVVVTEKMDVPDARLFGLNLRMIFSKRNRPAIRDSKAGQGA